MGGNTSLSCRSSYNASINVINRARDEVRLCDPCVRVSRVSLVCPAAPPGVFTGPAPGLRLLSRPRFRPSRGRAGVSLGLDHWMVVRFVCGSVLIRVPVCARVSRACPVCVPAPPVSFYRSGPVPVTPHACVSRLPPVSFYR